MIHLLFILFFGFAYAQEKKGYPVPDYIKKEFEDIAEKMEFKKDLDPEFFIMHNDQKLSFFNYKRNFIPIGIEFAPWLDTDSMLQPYARSGKPTGFMVQVVEDIGQFPSERKYWIGHELGHAQQIMEDHSLIDFGCKLNFTQSNPWLALAVTFLGVGIYGMVKNDKPAKWSGILGLGLGGATMAYSYKSRVMELDADRRAVLALKNYDDAIRSIKGLTPEPLTHKLFWFMRTHPNDSVRIAQFERLKKLDPEYQKS